MRNMLGKTADTACTLCAEVRKLDEFPFIVDICPTAVPISWPSISIGTQTFQGSLRCSLFREEIRIQSGGNTRLGRTMASAAQC